MSELIHKTSDVQTKNIGENTRIWQYCVILPGAQIGADCNICSHTFIENKVKIGNRVTVKFSVHICDGITIGDDVFIGPQVSFSNDKFPRSKYHSYKFLQTCVENGASIGAGAVILPGITIGEGAMVGAGSVVTKSVPAGAVVVGNPARVVGYVNQASPI